MRRHCFLWGTFYAVACLFFTTCGLDTVVVLNEPTVVHNISYYSTVNPLDWYVDFKTEEDANDDLPGATFIGTEIYYKIYNNYATLSSHKSAISSVNTSSDSTAAATRMIETYTYQPLNTSPAMKNSVFVPNSGTDQNVYLRLKTYKNTDGGIGYRAAIAFPHGNNEYVYYGSDASGAITTYTYSNAEETWKNASGAVVDYDSIEKRLVVPYRTVSGAERSFDFFDDNDTKSSVHSEPVDGDIDYYPSGSFSSGYENTYFVQLYAVAVALDTSSCANTYSLVLDLGTIPIKKGE